MKSPEIIVLCIKEKLQAIFLALNCTESEFRKTSNSLLLKENKPMYRLKFSFDMEINHLFVCFMMLLICPHTSRPYMLIRHTVHLPEVLHVIWCCCLCVTADIDGLSH